MGSALCARRESAVLTQSPEQTGILFAMSDHRDAVGHEDDPLDQLRLLDVRHRLVAALELGAIEVVAVAQRRDVAAVVSHRHRMISCLAARRQGIRRARLMKIRPQPPIMPA
jgi:hypothetical protein